MKKFVFSLQKVLGFKEQTLELLKNELAIIQRELESIDKKIEELHQVFADSNKTLVGQMENGITANQVGVYKIYLSEISAHIRQKNEERHQVELRIAQKQIQILGASIEIASLEKLREKQYEEHRLLEQKEQEIELNEFINNLSVM